MGGGTRRGSRYRAGPHRALPPAARITRLRASLASEAGLSLPELIMTRAAGIVQKRICK